MSIAVPENNNENIVKEYIPLVKYIASRVILGKTKHVEFEDLVGYGMVGLMDAIQKYDKDKGMKFSTYASIRIKGSMIDELRRNSPISKGAMDKLNRYNVALEKLQMNNFREPTIQELAEELSISIEEVRQTENNINYISVISLEDLIVSEDDEIPLIGAIEDENSPSPEKFLEEEEKLKYLSEAIDLLGEKDRTVLSLYYYEEMTLKEIGSVLGVSESRVCQLHSRAISNLKKSMQKLKYSM